MKILKIYFYLFLLFNISNVKSEINNQLKNTGIITFATEIASRVLNRNFNNTKTLFYANKLSYVSGGIKLLYPPNFFVNSPYTVITLQVNKLDTSRETILNPIIVSNTAEGIIVKVQKLKSGFVLNSVKEAADDDVIVHIFAIGE